MEIKIPFLGMSRTPDDALSADGECIELINARVKSYGGNSYIEPVPKPILKFSSEIEYSNVYWHELADRYLGVCGKRLYSFNDIHEKSLFEELGEDIISVYISGTIVSVSTNDNTYYLIFKDGDYTYLGEMPNVPYIKIGTESKFWGMKYGEDYDDAKVEIDSSTYEDEDEYKFHYAKYNKLKSYLNKHGYFFNATILRFAYRLFDGSYIDISQPIYLGDRIGDSKEYTNGKYNDDSVVDFQPITISKTNKYQLSQKLENNYLYSTYGMMGIKPTFEYSNLIPEGWEDIILSVDIFASRGIYRNPWEFGGLYGNDYLTDNEDIELYKTVNGISFNKTEIESIKETSTFYKIASLRDNDESEFWLDDVSDDVIVSKESLPDDYSNGMQFVAKQSYLYNGMIHSFCQTETLRKKYDFAYFCEGNNGHRDVTAVVELFIDGKTYFVSSGFETNGTINSYISYPNKNAKRIYFLDSEGKKQSLINLLPHESLNLSFYVKQNGTNYSDYQIPYIDNGDKVDVTLSKYKKETRDKLKVSEANNPFVFPVSQTYQFQDDISAVYSNTVAFSQGQFGQFPLYVFTKGGIYAMNQGAGVTYASTTPVTRDICVSDSVIGIDRSVIFISERGVMSIQGAESQCISEPINGFISPIIDNSEAIKTLLEGSGLDENISNERIDLFLKGATLGYSYANSEVYVSNKSYNYSFVFNMTTGTWHKISMKIDSFVNKYPDVYALVTEGETKIYDLNNRDISYAKIAVITRPIKLGSDGLKKVSQSALSCMIKSSSSNILFKGSDLLFQEENITLFDNVAFYLFGSNDSISFHPIAGCEPSGVVRDVITSYCRSGSYKYFILCIIGGVRTDVYLNNTRMMVESVYGDRLR